MKNLLFALLLSVALVAGCSTNKGTFGNNSVKAQERVSAVSTVDKKIADNTATKLQTVGQYSYGISISTNNAIDHVLNRRIESLAGQPTITQQNAMRQIVRDLEQTNYSLLSAKDGEIAALQSGEQKLELQKEQAVSQVETLSSQLALNDDTEKSELAKYQSFFGLGGVVLGLWQFIKTSLWFLIGGVLVFFLLRALSSVNPIFGTIFSIFEGAAYGVFKTVEFFVPSLTTMVQKVETDISTIASEPTPAPAPTVPTPSAPVSGSV